MNRCQTTRNVPLLRSKLLESFFPAFLIISSPSKNQTKTRPKSDRFRECEFISHCPATTYNFSALKRSDFYDTQGSCLCRRELPRSPDRGVPASVFIGTFPQRLCVSAVRAHGNKLAIYCTETEQNRTIFGGASISATRYQQLTTTRRPVVRFFKRRPMIVTDCLLNSGLPPDLRPGWVFIVPTP